jgi:hypothetical protein
MIKRMELLSDISKVELIYWDRLVSQQDFSLNQKINLKPIKLKAPQGKPFLRIFPYILFFIRALFLILKKRPKLIYAGNIDMLFIASIYKIIFNKNLKIVYEIGDLPKYVFVENYAGILKILAKLFIKLDKFLEKYVDLLVLTSSYFWDLYYKKFYDDNKYLIMLNAPPKKLFKNFKKKQHDKFVLGFIGSIRYSEQLKLAIDVCERLENVEFFLAGDGPEYEEILNYSKNKETTNLYGAYNYFEEVVSLYEKIDCVYSVYDTSKDNVKYAFPNKLYEAIVCELPIIVSSNTKLAEFVERNGIGYSIESERNELKNVLLKIKNNAYSLNINSNIKEIKDDYFAERFDKDLKNRVSSLF